MLSYGEKIAKISPVNPEIFVEIRRTTRWTRNAILIRMFFAETTGLIFTKILHDIVALVRSRSKTKSCCHLANVQRMHVVSVCLHFGNIIWLSWQRPLTNWKTKVQIHHRHVKRFHTVKRLWNSVQYVLRYSMKYAEPQRENTMQFWLESSMKLQDRSSPKFYTM